MYTYVLYMYFYLFVYEIYKVKYTFDDEIN